ncbi:hypothetical protein shim_40130 [Shimia sp. SK013]|uniref:hypothetical protein n=1 Tax=Shimia sp. SK013 TaxID=1389006 RepID=UPI0006B52035|nr:hypothetical protein [Shimia sp. SK013]KPA20054.1 hypothetical protein shim_40130 [Shimia sp. SK013]
MVFKPLTACACVAALSLLVAPVPAASQSERLIPLIDGRTCWAEGSLRCFRYSASSRRAHRAGFRPVIIPPEMEAKPGFISESAFIQVERAINKQTGGNR